MWGNLEGRDGGDLGWKVKAGGDLGGKLNLQPVAFLFLGLEVGADGDEEVVEKVMEGIGEDEGKCVLYQLHVGGGALAEVTAGWAALGVPRHLGHEQLPLQGALKQEAVEAGKG